MSKITGVARTNFFRVVDPAAFMHEMEQFDFTIHEKRVDGHLCFQLTDENSSGLFPTDWINEEGELEEIAFPKFISKFIDGDTVVIFESVIYSNKEVTSAAASAIDSNGALVKSHPALDVVMAKINALNANKSFHASCGLQDCMSAS